MKWQCEKTSTNTWLKRMLEEYDDLKLHIQ
ncbi:hypothetical protein AVP43_03221 [Geobacillus stearothermophilus]|nr:hypothetical protein AVP43_03221 [Geobacillus stearothermophilus]